MIIGSQAATAVLVFNAIKSPLAQPRNVIGGNMISALVGVAWQVNLGCHQQLRSLPLGRPTALPP
jgi:CBS-domain-containing membrane protein